MRNATAMLILAAAAVSCVKDTPGQGLRPGDRLPEFSVVTLAGRTAGSASLSGRPSVVILFSTTCPDCRRQLPEVESVHRTAGESVAVLAIARDDSHEAVASYWNGAGLTMDAAAPGNRQVYDLFDRGSRSGVPLVYLSDADGVITGFTDDSRTLTANEILTILFK